MTENLNVGIYQIRNIINDHVYIGQAGNLTRRKKQHFNDLRKNKHSNIHLQNAYNKYGVDNFEFEILLNSDPEDLTMYEQMFVDEFDPEYNIQKECVDSPKGLIPWNKGLQTSDEVKNKMSESLKGRDVWNKGLKGHIPWNKGKTGYSTSKKGTSCSNESREKMSKSGKKTFDNGRIIWNKGLKGTKGGKPGIPRDDSTKKKISEANKGHIPWNKGLKCGDPWNKNIPRTEEEKKNISNALLGKPTWNKGKKYSEEKKRIMREKRQATKIRKLSENV